MKIIAISNQKGGVAKTTTTMSLGAALAQLEKKVLMIDLDQQGSLTHSTGYDPDNLEVTIYDILSSYADMKSKSHKELDSVIIHFAHNLDLVPANMELSAIDLEIERAYQREFILQRAIKKLETSYDFILIDCPPSLSLLVVNALTAATDVIIPVQADYLATRGIKRLLEIIGGVKTNLNPNLKIDGILLTMADQRLSHTREIIKATRERYSGLIPVYDTIIKTSVRLKESPINGMSILEYDPGSEAAAAYRQLAREVINNGQTR